MVGEVVSKEQIVFIKGWQMLDGPLMLSGIIE